MTYPKYTLYGQVSVEDVSSNFESLAAMVVVNLVATYLRFSSMNASWWMRGAVPPP